MTNEEAEAKYGPVGSQEERNASMRTFDTGATRDTDDGKLDYEAYFSPLVLKRRAEYMQKHATQKDGTVRSGDNWQKGMPFGEYMKSLWRHFMDVWTGHRAEAPELLSDAIQAEADMEEALCAVMFNAEGMLHELLRDRD